MPLRIFSRAAAAALFALALSGIGGAQTTAPVRIATTPIDLGSEVLYANDLGYFHDAGLDVDVQVLASGSAVGAAVASGSVDIGEANLVSIASAHANGVPFVAIAPAGIYTAKAPTTELIVAKNSPLRTAKDLDGKTISVVALKDITQIGASAWIEKNGGDLASVKFVEVPQSAVCAAVASGRIDAGVVSEPFLAIAQTQGCRVLAACHDAIAPEFLVGAWFAQSPWALAHPDAVAKFRAVMVRTARWANAHRADSQRILEKYTKSPAPPDATRVTFVETLDPAQMQPLISAAAKYGAIKADFPAAELLPPH